MGDSRSELAPARREHAEEQNAGSPVRPAPRPVLATAAALLMIFTACKAANLAPGLPLPRAFFRDLMVVIHEDTVVVTAYALLLWTLSNVLTGHPRAERWAWRAGVALGAALALYALLSFRAYELLWTPITYRLLAIGGGLSGLVASARTGLTPGFALLLLGVPLGFFVTFTRLRGRRVHPRRSIRVGAAALAVALVLVFYQNGQITFDRDWTVRVDRPLGSSSHLVFLRSLVSDPYGGLSRPLRGLDVAFSPADGALFTLPRPMPPPITTSRPRGVILYVLESTGAEHLDPYGSTYGVTPRLGQISAKGIVFESVYANIGRTEGTLATLSLSRYFPLSWHLVTEDNPRAEGTTLATLLGARGYRTAFLSAGDLSFANQLAFLKGRGFDEISSGEELGCRAISHWGVADRCLVDRLLSFIDTAREAPFFVVAWTNQGHHPYPREDEHIPAPPLPRLPALPRGADNLGAYLTALREADAQLGRLDDGLAERGLADDVVLMVTGDHGEAFGLQHEENLSHGFRLYDESVRVPMVVRWPKALDHPGRRDRVGSHLDVTPTLAHLCGVPQAASWYGTSLFSESHPDAAYMFASSGDLMVGLREGRNKYIVDLWSGEGELYDLATDPLESRDLAKTDLELGAHLKRKLGAWVSENRRVWRQGEVPLRMVP